MIFDENVDKLLLRYLLNESDENERQQVESWLEADEDHRAYYQKIQMLHLKMRWMERVKLIKIDYSHFDRKWKRNRRLRSFYQYAASVIILLGIGGILWMLGEERSEKREMIQPGTSQAMLYMASGQIVNVDKDTQKLKELDGTRIDVDSAGMITYSGDTEENNSEVLYNRVVVPKGGEFKLTLSDGTKVWLNSYSELRYPVNFTGKRREVTLKGEAYFDVVGNLEHPFVVKVDDLEISVLGTQFNVNAHSSGYVRTVLVEGSVNLKGKNGEINLHPHQMGEYREIDGELSMTEVDVLPYIAWKDGNFIFRSESLESIMDKLSVWYNLNVFYTRDELRNIRLSGNLFRYGDVNQLFHFFEKISHARFSVKGRNVIISDHNMD